MLIKTIYLYPDQLKELQKEGRVVIKGITQDLRIILLTDISFSTK